MTTHVPQLEARQHLFRLPFTPIYGKSLYTDFTEAHTAYGNYPGWAPYMPSFPAYEDIREGKYDR